MYHQQQRIGKTHEEKKMFKRNRIWRGKEAKAGNYSLRLNADTFKS